MSFLSKIFGGGEPKLRPQPDWFARFAEAGAHAPYAVELRTPAPLTLDPRRILAKLRETHPTADLIGDGELFGFAFPDRPIELADRRICYTINVAQRVSPPASELAASLSQSWAWKEARRLVPAMRGIVRLNDMGGGHLEGKDRLALVTAVLDAIWQYDDEIGLAVLDGAVHWIPAQHVLPFQKWVALSEVRGPVGYAVNVRLFNVGDGVAGETLMDTMGLAALGLPELQCWFTALEPNEVANVLYPMVETALGGHEFQPGDAVEISEAPFKMREPWRLERAEAKSAPARDMLSLIPGEYAVR